MGPSLVIRVHTCVVPLILVLLTACGAVAQISPNEIRDPELKVLEKQYFPELKSLNQTIARMHFPFPLYISKYVGLEPANRLKPIHADSNL